MEESLFENFIAIYQSLQNELTALNAKLDTLTEQYQQLSEKNVNVVSQLNDLKAELDKCDHTKRIPRWFR